MTLSLIGGLVLAAWAGGCFWLAVRYQRRCLQRGVRVNHGYLRTMIASGAACGFMAFYVLFTTFNPVPPLLDQPLRR
jgi:hypothetical protein